MVVTGAPVATIVPGEGVRLEGGELVRAAAVVSSAIRSGPSSAVRRRRAGHLPVTDPRMALREPGRQGGTARSPGSRRSPPRPIDPIHVYRAQVEIVRGIEETQSAYESCRRGEPAPEWCEIYFQTAYDPTVAPPGADTMSVFAQYAPYTLANGTWATRRDEIGDRVLDAIARFAPDVADCVLEARSSDRPTSSPASA